MSQVTARCKPPPHKAAAAIGDGVAVGTKHKQTKVQHEQMRWQGLPTRQSISPCTDIPPFTCMTITCSYSKLILIYYIPTINKRNRGKPSRTGGDVVLVGGSNEQPEQYVEGHVPVC